MKVETDATAYFPSLSFAVKGRVTGGGNYPLPDGVGVPTRPLEVRLPTLDAWNLTIQQEINKSTALQIAYVGSHGIHNMFDSSNQFDPNQATIAGFNQVNTIDPATPNTLPRCTEYMPIEICLPNDWDAYSL